MNETQSYCSFLQLILYDCAVQVSILQADGEVYAALLDGKLAVKLGTGAWSPADAGLPPPGAGKYWALVASGFDYAVRVGN